MSERKGIIARAARCVGAAAEAAIPKLVAGIARTPAAPLLVAVLFVAWFGPLVVEGAVRIAMGRIPGERRG